MKASAKLLLKATSTPLASIFGSGFLVIVPILNGAVGPYSVYAMAAVCLIAFAMGSVIRYNIRNVEPLLDADTAPEITISLEKVSDLLLILAYGISVCLYIRILASFLLDGLNLDTQFNEHLVTIIIIGFIGIVGYVKGLKILEDIEILALIITIFIIIALFIGFGYYDISQLSNSGIILPKLPDRNFWDVITIIGGTLIVVQGFETSRYLEDDFDTETRIRSSRWSQIISTVVYVIFILLATPLMHFLGDTVKDSSLIMLAGKASIILPAPLVIAAVMSQFSAAVADTIGGGGNMEETLDHKIDTKHSYLLICGGAIILSFNSTLEILALASRAFAFYYTIQCLVAISISKSLTQKIAIGLIALILAFITIFAIPAG